MDDREKIEEQIEDLEVEQAEAEDVKGGASPQLGPTVASQKVNLDVANRGGWDANHNETIVAL